MALDENIFPTFEFGLNKLEFLEKYKDLANKNFLIRVWEFGNASWRKGYNRGKYDPDFDNK